MKATFSIEGMTCASCSSTVLQTMRNHEGVNSGSAQVNLLLARATADFDPNVTTAENIAESISNTGFEAGVVSVSSSANEVKGIKNFRKASYSLGGLTCVNCVTAVENGIKGLKGIDTDSVRVSLLPSARLECNFDASLTNAILIKDMVEAIGFEADLESEESVGILEEDTAVIQLSITTDHTFNNEEEKETMLKELMRLLQARVGENGVLNLQLDVAHRKSKKAPRKHESSVTVPLLSEKIFIKVTVNDTIIKGSRDLIHHIRAVSDTISDVRVLSRKDHNPNSKATDDVEVDDDARGASSISTDEAKVWKRKFVQAASLTVPVFLFCMVFPKIDAFNSIFGKDVLDGVAISWAELFSWILSTPVQFVLGYQFYRESYQSVKNKLLGMSFLVMMGTTVSYFYSVAALLYNSIVKPKVHMMPAFDSSSMLITFVLLGKTLEAYAKSRTTQALANLAKLAASEAILVEVEGDNDNIDAYMKPDARERTIPAELIQKDDVLKVFPGAKVPADGVVVWGQTSIDEAMVTGESVPVGKKVGDQVIGATVNVDSMVLVKVTRLAQNSTLSQILKLVQDAQATRAPIQAIADIVSSKFVPFVLAVSLSTFLIWNIVLYSGAFDSTIDNWPHRQEGMADWVFALLFSVAVLVIACPCALGLATPTAIMVGTGVGAKHGVLIKGGEPLETAHKLTAVVFDKTGTLTKGKPSLSDVVLISDHFLASARRHVPAIPQQEPSAEAQEGTTETRKSLGPTFSSVNVEGVEVWGSATEVDAGHLGEAGVVATMYTALAESGSEHPLANGIIEFRDQLLATFPDLVEVSSELASDVTDMKAIPGKGVSCKIDGKSVLVGNRRLIEDGDVSLSPGTSSATMSKLEEQGKTTVILAIEGKPVALFALRDMAKEESAATIAILHDMGIKVFMLTGDNRRTAVSIARGLNLSLTNVITDVLPHEKAKVVQNLKDKGETVAMVGDGVNDSPALAVADLGVAIGAGTDVAIEAAAVVLMRSNLLDVVTAIHLSRVTFTRIKLNFVWALGFNCIGIPVAAGAFYPWIHTAVPPYAAAAAMAMSSVTVVLSSLLLQRYTPPSVVTKRFKMQTQMKYGDSTSPQIKSELALNSIVVDYHGDVPPEPTNALGSPVSRTRLGRGVVEVRCAMSLGQACDCGEGCRCVSCPIHSRQRISIDE